MTTPLLEKLQIIFFNQLTLSIPCLLEFMNTTVSLRFSSAEVIFDDEAFHVRLYPYEGAALDASFIRVGCTSLKWQVASAVQISNQLRTVLSAVVYLTFKYSKDPISLESNNNEGDYTQWCEIHSSFNNMKILHVPNGLVKDLSHSLQFEEGESPVELLPKLKKLEYATMDDVTA
jgi:hypothetical protein